MTIKLEIQFAEAENVLREHGFDLPVAEALGILANHGGGLAEVLNSHGRLILAQRVKNIYRAIHKAEVNNG